MSTETIREEIEVRLPRAWAERSEVSTAGSTSSPGCYFAFFFISGFSSILYELIWLRLAMAQFGVTTAMVSIVLSTFMAGLGLGSWAAGYLVRKYGSRLAFPPLRLYALAELFIAASALIVPQELLAGRFLLEHVGSSLSLSSFGYYMAAGLSLAFSLIPWCACMGATIPLAMFAIRHAKCLESRRSFSFLYLANVLGAVAGALIPLLFIEIFGFSGTLRLGMALNLAIFVAVFAFTRKQSQPNLGCEGIASGNTAPGLRQMFASSTLWLLFATGLTSMGMEVVWTRQYTPYLGTFVYSFAAILAVYLAATFIGSFIYRVWSRRHNNEGVLIWLIVWFVSFLPLLTADPRLGIPEWLRVPLGIAVFSGLLGFLTPMLVDRFSQGDPDRAGVGYAVNVAGCILGPLFAGFILLPHLNERQALLVLALPWLLVGSPFRRFQQAPFTKQLHARRAIASCAVGLASLGLILGTQSFEHQFPNGQLRRDSTATVIAAGNGMNKQLIVNGINMTVLTPITKLMASMPLAFLDHQPKAALVICFGMGTTHRSVLSWGIDSTAVDLVPSVPSLFSYYHADGSELLKAPRSHVVIDDGRRFLERTAGQYDVIVIDPPPPIQAAGSSLLYSREFYSAAKKRLRSDGILQQWFPGGSPVTLASVARALKESFPYVRAFGSIEGWGVHFLASQQPIPDRTAAELAGHMPASAAADLVEWGPFQTAQQQFAAVLKNEVPIKRLVAENVYSPAMQDDRPINEYYLLRKLGAWLYRGGWNPPVDPNR